MKLQTFVIAVIVFAVTHASWAGDKKEAAVGGAIGGALGAVVGEELGDRKGAIVGAAIGAAIGTAIAIDDDKTSQEPSVSSAVKIEVDVSAPEHPQVRHCPPGQAKKGRC